MDAAHVGPVGHRISVAAPTVFVLVVVVALVALVALMGVAVGSRSSNDAWVGSDASVAGSPGWTTGSTVGSAVDAVLSTTSSAPSSPSDPTTTESTTTTGAPGPTVAPTVPAPRPTVPAPAPTPPTTVPATVPVAPPTTASTPFTGGYTVAFGVTRINPNMVVRFQGPVPPSVVAGIDLARQRINQLTGSSWTMGPPTGAPAAFNEIVVTMRGASRCGTPTNGDTTVFGCTMRTAASYVVTADIEINPAVVGTPWSSSTLLHEMGHAAGLDDYNGTVGGAWQVMRTSSVAGLTDYQAGDINGLRALAT